MLDDAAVALIIVLIVMALKEQYKPSKATAGLILLAVGAIIGLAQGAAKIYMPAWAYQAIVYGLAMALAGGTAYGIITAHEQAKIKQIENPPT